MVAWLYMNYPKQIILNKIETAGTSSTVAKGYMCGQSNDGQWSDTQSIKYGQYTAHSTHQ